MIASGEIARGSRIRQSGLAERFASSVTPVREALQQLQAEGVIVGEPHRGLRVAEADLDAIKGAYVARRLVEPHAAQRASRRITRRDLDALDALIERMAEAHAAGDGATASEANHAFHFGIYARCGLPALTRRIEDLWLAYPWDILHVLREHDGLVLEHRAILDAVREADQPRIAEAVSAHIAGGYRELVAHLAGSAGGDPFDLDTD